ncbi:hypothetical protein DJ568_00625 [Mucilaginibacter hurinus]|uniref:DUF4185 domain-containing protein n=1 Tax=Mucilaginibacter hurinus TaxID=2201324 RepID=A0A367GSJ2_9SPHI|nr:hypothetical protein [Mucilaginibacter hurinus]RCH56397.1 hypothetical protein DJ568_00625 [Mucilaginibacter hurinus]
MMRQSGYADNFTTVISSGTGGARTTFKFPENNSNIYNNNRLWPHHGFESGNTVSAFFGAYNGSMQFQGNYLAEFNYNITSSSGITMTKLNYLNTSGIAWGQWTISQGDSVFVYGTKLYETTYNTSAAYVARVLKTKLKSSTAGDWKFWTGTSWSNSPTAAAPIRTGLSNHLSVVKFLNTSGQARYAIINQEVNFGTCNAGTKIYSYGLASTPTGPFNTQKVLYTITDKLPGAPAGSNTMLTYDAQAHPEHAGLGLLLISYNVNGDCTGTCNPWTLQVPADGYRPKFIRTDIKDIDASLASVAQTW